MVLISLLWGFYPWARWLQPGLSVLVWASGTCLLLCHSYSCAWSWTPLILTHRLISQLDFPPGLLYRFAWWPLGCVGSLWWVWPILWWIQQRLCGNLLENSHCLHRVSGQAIAAPPCQTLHLPLLPICSEPNSRTYFLQVGWGFLRKCCPYFYCLNVEQISC